jgi:hypothetical protein
MFCYLARDKTSVTQRTGSRLSIPAPTAFRITESSAIVTDGVAVGPWPQAQPALHGKMNIVVACWRHTPLCRSQLIALYCGATGARHAPLHRLPLQPRPQPAPPLLSPPIPSTVGSHCHVMSHAPHGASSLPRHVAPRGASSLPRHVACTTRRFVTATPRRSTRRFVTATPRRSTRRFPRASNLPRCFTPPSRVATPERPARYGAIQPEPKAVASTRMHAHLG